MLFKTKYRYVSFNVQISSIVSPQVETDSPNLSFEYPTLFSINGSKVSGRKKAPFLKTVSRSELTLCADIQGVTAAQGS